MAVGLWEAITKVYIRTFMRNQGGHNAFALIMMQGSNNQLPTWLRLSGDRRL